MNRIEAMKGKIHSKFGMRLLAVTVAGAFCMLPNMVSAVLANRTETWDNGQLNSWGGESDPGVLLANPADCLKISFPAQGLLMPGVGVAAGGVEASGGIFSGDYRAHSISNITFSLMTDGHIPSFITVVLRGAKSGREWSYSPIDVSAVAGVWVSNSVPLDFSTGRWRLSGPGGNESHFLKDLEDVDMVGIRIERSGTSAQTYSIDSFLLGGVNLPGKIRGKINYKGYQEGVIRVVAASKTDAWTGPNVTELNKPGNYELSDVAEGSNYWVKAYLDTNSNGMPDALEPMGAYPANSVEMKGDLDLVNDVDITLTEAVNKDGLPLWWVQENSMGLVETDMLADADADGDGVSNIKEYIAGTDPQDASSTFKAKAEHKQSGNGFVLKWKAPHSNNKYQVWRASDLMAGFTLLQGGIDATPPENSFEDTTATGDGPYFYRIKVEEQP